MNTLKWIRLTDGTDMRYKEKEKRKSLFWVIINRVVGDVIFFLQIEMQPKVIAEG